MVFSFKSERAEQQRGFKISTFISRIGLRWISRTLEGQYRIGSLAISNTAAVTQLALAAGCSVEEYVNSLIKQAADLEAIREGYEDVKAGRVTPLAEFDQSFRQEMGFGPRTDS